MVKSRVMDSGQLFNIYPQGVGGGSPLLNIALHGMEERIKQFGNAKGNKHDNRCSLA